MSTTELSELARPVGQQDISNCLDRLPPFSPVVRLLLTNLSADSDDVPLAKLAALIEEDIVISGKVLSVVNSARYGRSQRICSVRQAVSRLGVDALRNLVLGLSVNRIWSGLRVPDNFSMLRFNRHALATAMLSDILAQRIAVRQSEGAFVAGLFHDVGQLVLVSLFPKAYSHILETVPPEEVEDLERQSFGLTHGEVSGLATALWKLPLAVQNAVRSHENPPAIVDPNAKSDIPLEYIVHIADGFVSTLGISTIAAPVEGSNVQHALSQFDIDDAKLCEEFLPQFNSLV